MAQSAPLQLSDKDLRQWDLRGAFPRALARRVVRAALPRSWSDARRVSDCADYLSLFLLGLFNPVLQTRRALGAASQLPRVQREVSAHSVSLGSFSEAQHLTDPALLEQVLGDLVGPGQGPPPTAVRPAWQQWLARASSLLAARPRRSWALYGGGKAGGPNNAVRPRLHLHLWEDKPARAPVPIGKRCERKAGQEDWESGAAYVGDRYCAQNYRLLGPLEKKGCRDVRRLQDQAIITIQEELPLRAEDQAAGILRQAWARLGGASAVRGGRVRVIWIQTQAKEELRLVTNVAPDQLSAGEVGRLYRRRWQIECFFRWLKCLLGCRHGRAESPAGVRPQLYLALIAAVLFPRHAGRRPHKRMMELYQLHPLGWASPEDLRAGWEREQPREDRRQAQAKKIK